VENRQDARIAKNLSASLLMRHANPTPPTIDPRMDHVSYGNLISTCNVCGHMYVPFSRRCGVYYGWYGPWPPLHETAVI